MPTNIVRDYGFNARALGLYYVYSLQRMSYNILQAHLPYLFNRNPHSSNWTLDFMNFKYTHTRAVLLNKNYTYGPLAIIVWSADASCCTLPHHDLMAGQENAYYHVFICTIGGHSSSVLVTPALLNKQKSEIDSGKYVWELAHQCKSISSLDNLCYSKEQLTFFDNFQPIVFCVCGFVMALLLSYVSFGVRIR